MGTAAVREADPIQYLELTRIVISDLVVPDPCGGLGPSRDPQKLSLITPLIMRNNSPRRDCY